MKNAVILPIAFVGGLFWGCAARGPAGGAEGIAERLDEIAQRLDAIEARDLGELSRRLEALEKGPSAPAPAQADLSKRVKELERVVGLEQYPSSYSFRKRLEKLDGVWQLR